MSLYPNVYPECSLSLLSTNPSPVNTSISCWNIHLLSTYPSPVGLSIIHLLSSHLAYNSSVHWRLFSQVDTQKSCRKIQPPFYIYTEDSHILSAHTFSAQAGTSHDTKSSAKHCDVQRHPATVATCRTCSSLLMSPCLITETVRCRTVKEVVSQGLV